MKVTIIAMIVALTIPAIAADKPAPSPMAVELNRLVAECLANGVIPASAADTARNEFAHYVTQNPCVFELTKDELASITAGTLDDKANGVELNRHLAAFHGEPLPGILAYLVGKHKAGELKGRRLLLTTRMLRCQAKANAAE